MISSWLGFLNPLNKQMRQEIYDLSSLQAVYVLIVDTLASRCC